ncbi:MAG: hypothetical protein KKF62_00455 [Bacteroidetes bacterium]|nr:hypothetical protein [Bacteroidota bacterium]MBU1113867.1 hypothetical protein [Bacteroidota bacterium]MBU1798107.1 hypothetical protein [Bacteroidota bacterium]
MNKKINYLVLILFLAFDLLFAQTGAIYSRFGIGDILNSNTARRMGFGELGSAVIDKDYIDGYNPASWTELEFTRFGISAKYNSANFSDNNSSAFHSDVLFSGFIIGFPIQKDLGISAAIGLIPVTSLSYDISKNVKDDVLGDYSEKFSGSGSLSKVFIGTSFLIPTNTSIGLSLEYYTGANNYLSYQNFASDADYEDVSYETKYKFRGMGSTISAISGNILNLFNTSENSSLRLSVLANITPDLTTDTSIVATTSIGEIENLIGETKTVMPTKYTLGASFAWDKKYLILFDYMFQPWSKYQFNGKYDPNMKDLVKYSLGFEYKDKTLGMHASTSESISYRFGISYEETQYTFNGININQYSLHSGITIPFGDINMIDFAIAAGLRGTIDNNLIKEQFLNAAFTLTLGELWFVREDR